MSWKYRRTRSLPNEPRNSWNTCRSNAGDEKYSSWAPKRRPRSGEKKRSSGANHATLPGGSRDVTWRLAPRMKICSSGSRSYLTKIVDREKGCRWCRNSCAPTDSAAFLLYTGLYRGTPCGDNSHKGYRKYKSDSLAVVVLRRLCIQPSMHRREKAIEEGNDVSRSSCVRQKESQ